MKAIKLAATALVPVICLNSHPHIEGHAFVPEPQPMNPFIQISTATANVLRASALLPFSAIFSELEGTQFKVTL